MRKVLSVFSVMVVIMSSMLIMSCNNQKDEGPAIFPIGYVKSELADSGEEQVHSFTANYVINYDSSVRNAKELLEEKRNDISYQIGEYVGDKSSTDVDEQEDMGPLGEELTAELNSLFEEPVIESVTVQDSDLKTIEAEFVGGEE